MVTTLKGRGILERASAAVGQGKSKEVVSNAVVIAHKVRTVVIQPNATPPNAYTDKLTSYPPMWLNALSILHMPTPRPHVIPSQLAASRYSQVPKSKGNKTLSNRAHTEGKTLNRDPTTRGNRKTVLQRDAIPQKETQKQQKQQVCTPTFHLIIVIRKS